MILFKKKKKQVNIKKEKVMIVVWVEDA